MANPFYLSDIRRLQASKQALTGRNPDPALYDRLIGNELATRYEWNNQAAAREQRQNEIATEARLREQAIDQQEKQGYASLAVNAPLAIAGYASMAEKLGLPIGKTVSFLGQKALGERTISSSATKFAPETASVAAPTTASYLTGGQALPAVEYGPVYTYAPLEYGSTGLEIGSGLSGGGQAAALSGGGAGAGMLSSSYAAPAALEYGSTGIQIGSGIGPGGAGTVGATTAASVPLGAYAGPIAVAAILAKSFYDYGTGIKNNAVNAFRPGTNNYGFTVPEMLLPIHYSVNNQKWVDYSGESGAYVDNPGWEKEYNDLLGEFKGSKWLDPQFLAQEFQRQTGETPGPMSNDEGTAKRYEQWLFSQPEYQNIVNKTNERYRNRNIQKSFGF
jgi:hypothetical protein